MKKYTVQIEFLIPLNKPRDIIVAMNTSYVTLSWTDGADNMFHVIKEIEVPFASEKQIDEYVLALGGAVYRIYSTSSDALNGKTVQVYDRKYDTRFR